MKNRFGKQTTDKTVHSIYHAENGKQYVVKSTPDLGILKSLGIIKNANVIKKLTYRLGGPVLLMVETSEIAIGKDIAEKIMVGEAYEHGNVS